MEPDIPSGLNRRADMTTTKNQTLPMKTAGTQHLIDRTYRESGRFQWARETLVNALEAGATKVEFGIEWQAVERKKTYRRFIADNGKGMSPDQLVEFFNTFGGGGKPIGGVHENFGVGSKTSLMPWNRHGLVVVSWVDGEASMIWVRQDKNSGEYGLRLFRAIGDDSEETLEAVVTPFLDTKEGVDWSTVGPEWVRQSGHGTVIVLLGNAPDDNTVLGDPNREEAELKGLAAYLNRRIWEIPKDTEIFIEELRSSDRRSWPGSLSEAHSSTPARTESRTNKRTIMGAAHYIKYTGFLKGALTNSGEVVLKDSTKIHWFLWEGERPGIHSYAANQGFIAAIYKNELYDMTSHLAVYRSFGVTDPGVRQRLWLVIEPQPYDEKLRRGVYPRTDRNTLLLRGGPDAGEPLPVSTWGAEFADNMPEPIKEAIKAAYHDTGTLEDRAWRDKLAERFGDRWRVMKLKVASRGSLTVDASQLGSEPVIKPKRPKQEREERDAQGAPKNITGTGGIITVGVSPGSSPAEKARLGVNIPTYRTARSGEMESGMMAAWAPKEPDHPEGVVLLNVDHPVLMQQLKFWQQQYADHLAPEVEREVLDVYGQVAVAKVAHSEKLRGILPSETVDRELRSESALTMGLLGLMAEEALIAARLGAKLGRKRQHEST
jgi:hypothetical protein